jgi:hypothetical protein
MSKRKAEQMSESNYVCDACGRQYSRRSSLYEHSKYHHQSREAYLNMQQKNRERCRKYQAKLQQATSLTEATNPSLATSTQAETTQSSTTDARNYQTTEPRQFVQSELVQPFSEVSSDTDEQSVVSNAIPHISTEATSAMMTVSSRISVNETSVPVFQTLNTYQVATPRLASVTQPSSATAQRDLSVHDTSSVYQPHPSMNSYTGQQDITNEPVSLDRDASPESQSTSSSTNQDSSNTIQPYAFFHAVHRIVNTKKQTTANYYNMLKHDFSLRECNIIIEAVTATQEVLANKILTALATTDDAHLRNSLKSFVEAWYR